MSEANLFKLASDMKPCGDQPQAIEKLLKGFKSGMKEQVLLGVTGSGKTFTMANVIAQLGRPALVLSHNKTLAAQLYSEMKEFFPENSVEYFVSYYDYYQPEAYISHSDTYIEKDASINDNLDRLRLAATSAVLSRPDCIIVSSVSCIYGLGAPEDWQNMLIAIESGETKSMDDFLIGLIRIQYERSVGEFKRGSFRVRGGKVDIFPAYSEHPLRVEFSDTKIESIWSLDPINFQPQKALPKLAIYPAKHFVTSNDRVQAAMAGIEAELIQRLRELNLQNKDLEAKRLQSRTRYDLEMLKELGYCSGIENYSRHLAGREPGSTPATLVDYFPKDFILMIDESHQTIPQIRGMFNGDFARKKNLVEFGFRLPSALDNRPLKFDEFEKKVGQVLYVSATPGPYEMGRKDQVVEQVIRPTGLVDPLVEVRKTDGQIDDLMAEIKIRAKKQERVMVTTITKKMAEDLSRYLSDLGIKVSYIHSEFDAFERVEILRDLRLNKYDCIIGVNLLREGLDLPEVSLVAILDADKEGFLRSDVSLIQISGRAARHLHGLVIMYADRVTDSMKRAMGEMDRRRKIQLQYNADNNIKPTTIIKEIRNGIEKWKKAEDLTHQVVGESDEDYRSKSYLSSLKAKMEQAAAALEFDKAAYYRDKIREFEKEQGVTESTLGSFQPSAPMVPQPRKGKKRGRS